MEKHVRSNKCPNCKPCQTKRPNDVNVICVDVSTDSECACTKSDNCSQKKERHSPCRRSQQDSTLWAEQLIKIIRKCYNKHNTPTAPNKPQISLSCDYDRCSYIRSRCKPQKHQCGNTPCISSHQEKKKYSYDWELSKIQNLLDTPCNSLQNVPSHINQRCFPEQQVIHCRCPKKTKCVNNRPAQCCCYKTRHLWQLVTPDGTPLPIGITKSTCQSDFEAWVLIQSESEVLSCEDLRCNQLIQEKQSSKQHCNCMQQQENIKCRSKPLNSSPPNSHGKCLDFCRCQYCQDRKASQQQPELSVTQPSSESDMVRFQCNPTGFNKATLQQKQILQGNSQAYAMNRLLESNASSYNQASHEQNFKFLAIAPSAPMNESHELNASFNQSHPTHIPILQPPLTSSSRNRSHELNASFNQSHRTQVQMLQTPPRISRNEACEQNCSMDQNHSEHNPLFQAPLGESTRNESHEFNASFNQGHPSQILMLQPPLTSSRNRSHELNASFNQSHPTQIRMLQAPSRTSSRNRVCEQNESMHQNHPEHNPSFQAPLAESTRNQSYEFNASFNQGRPLQSPLTENPGNRSHLLDASLNQNNPEHIRMLQNPLIELPINRTHEHSASFNQNPPEQNLMLHDTPLTEYPGNRSHLFDASLNQNNPEHILMLHDPLIELPRNRTHEHNASFNQNLPEQNLMLHDTPLTEYPGNRSHLLDATLNQNNSEHIRMLQDPLIELPRNGTHEHNASFNQNLPEHNLMLHDTPLTEYPGNRSHLLDASLTQNHPEHITMLQAPLIKLPSNRAHDLNMSFSPHHTEQMAQASSSTTPGNRPCDFNVFFSLNHPQQIPMFQKPLLADDKNKCNKPNVSFNQNPHESNPINQASSASYNNKISYEASTSFDHIPHEQSPMLQVPIAAPNGNKYHQNTFNNQSNSESLYNNHQLYDNMPHFQKSSTRIRSKSSKPNLQKLEDSAIMLKTSHLLSAQYNTPSSKQYLLKSQLSMLKPHLIQTPKSSKRSDNSSHRASPLWSSNKNIPFSQRHSKVKTSNKKPFESLLSSYNSHQTCPSQVSFSKNTHNISYMSQTLEHYRKKSLDVDHLLNDLKIKKDMELNNTSNYIIPETIKNIAETSIQEATDSDTKTHLMSTRDMTNDNYNIFGNQVATVGSSTQTSSSSFSTFQENQDLTHKNVGIHSQFSPWYTGISDSNKEINSAQINCKHPSEYVMFKSKETSNYLSYLSTDRSLVDCNASVGGVNDAIQVATPEYGESRNSSPVHTPWWLLLKQTRKKFIQNYDLQSSVTDRAEYETPFPLSEYIYQPHVLYRSRKIWPKNWKLHSRTPSHQQPSTYNASLRKTRVSPSCRHILMPHRQHSFMSSAYINHIDQWPLRTTTPSSLTLLPLIKPSNMYEIPRFRTSLSSNENIPYNVNALPAFSTTQNDLNHHLSSKSTQTSNQELSDFQLLQQSHRNTLKIKNTTPQCNYSVQPAKYKTLFTETSSGTVVLTTLSTVNLKSTGVQTEITPPHEHNATATQTDTSNTTDSFLRRHDELSMILKSNNMHSNTYHPLQNESSNHESAGNNRAFTLFGSTEIRPNVLNTTLPYIVPDCTQRKNFDVCDEWHHNMPSLNYNYSINSRDPIKTTNTYTNASSNSTAIGLNNNVNNVIIRENPTLRFPSYLDSTEQVVCHHERLSEKFPVDKIITDGSCQNGRRIFEEMGRPTMPKKGSVLHQNYTEFVQDKARSTCCSQHGLFTGSSFSPSSLLNTNVQSNIPKQNWSEKLYHKELSLTSPSYVNNTKEESNVPRTDWSINNHQTDPCSNSSSCLHITKVQNRAPRTDWSKNCYVADPSLTALSYVNNTKVQNVLPGTDWSDYCLADPSLNVSSCVNKTLLQNSGPRKDWSKYCYPADPSLTSSSSVNNTKVKNNGPRADGSENCFPEDSFLTSFSYANNRKIYNSRPRTDRSENCLPENVSLISSASVKYTKVKNNAPKKDLSENCFPEDPVSTSFPYVNNRDICNSGPRTDWSENCLPKDPSLTSAFVNNKTKVQNNVLRTDWSENGVPEDPILISSASINNTKEWNSVLRTDWSENRFPEDSFSTSFPCVNDRKLPRGIRTDWSENCLPEDPSLASAFVKNTKVQNNVLRADWSENCFPKDSILISSASVNNTKVWNNVLRTDWAENHFPDEAASSAPVNITKLQNSVPKTDLSANCFPEKPSFISSAFINNTRIEDSRPIPRTDWSQHGFLAKTPSYLNNTNSNVNIDIQRTSSSQQCYHSNITSLPYLNLIEVNTSSEIPQENVSDLTDTSMVRHMADNESDHKRPVPMNEDYTSVKYNLNLSRLDPDLNLNLPDLKCVKQCLIEYPCLPSPSILNVSAIQVTSSISSMADRHKSIYNSAKGGINPVLPSDKAVTSSLSIVKHKSKIKSIDTYLNSQTCMDMKTDTISSTTLQNYSSSNPLIVNQMSRNYTQHESTSTEETEVHNINIEHSPQSESNSTIEHSTVASVYSNTSYQNVTSNKYSQPKTKRMKHHKTKQKWNVSRNTSPFTLFCMPCTSRHVNETSSVYTPTSQLKKETFIFRPRKDVTDSKTKDKSTKKKRGKKVG